MFDRFSRKSMATRWLLMTRTPCPRALIYSVSPEMNMSRVLELLRGWNVTVFIPASWWRQPRLICDVKNIANARKPFGTRWKITKGSLSESGYEPEDEAVEGGRSKVGRVVTDTCRH